MIKQKFEKMGWKFLERDYRYGGDSYDEIEFKSPRMSKFEMLIDSKHLSHNKLWAQLTDDYIIDRENFEAAKSKWADIKLDVENLVIKAVREGKTKVEVPL